MLPGKCGLKKKNKVFDFVVVQLNVSFVRGVCGGSTQNQIPSLIMKHTELIHIARPEYTRGASGRMKNKLAC